MMYVVHGKQIRHGRVSFKPNGVYNNDRNRAAVKVMAIRIAMTLIIMIMINHNVYVHNRLIM